MVCSVHEHHDYVRRHKFETPVSLQAVQHDWNSKGFSCSPQMARNSGDLLSKGVEKRDELLVVAQGKLECCVGESDVIILNPGDELFIPCSTPFECHVPKDVDSVLFYIGSE